MSDFINGYIEWRGRETLLKSQYGILDKETGNHLIPVKNPSEYMDGSDMDFVRSKPNQPPIQKNENDTDYDMVPAPYIEFTKVDWITEADKVGGKIKVKFEGTVNFWGVDVNDFYATINGKYQLPLSATGTDPQSFTGEIEMDEWEDVNILRVSAQGFTLNSGETDWGIRDIRLNDQFNATRPVITVDTLLDMPYDVSVNYQMTKNRARLDITGTLQAQFPGDKITHIIGGIINSARNKEFNVQFVKTVDEKGIESAKWRLSIPTVDIDEGSVDVFVEGYVDRNGVSDSMDVDIYIEKL